MTRLQTEVDDKRTIEGRLREDIVRVRASIDALSATKGVSEIELLRVRFDLKEAERNLDTNPVVVNLRSELQAMQQDHGDGKCVSQSKAKQMLEDYGV